MTTQCEPVAAVAPQAARAHTAAARWEVDTFRPTHVLPFTPFMELCVLARSLLRCCPMLSQCRLTVCGAQQHLQE